MEKVVKGVTVTALKYPHDWPFWTLIGAYAIAAAYKVFSDRHAATLRQQVFDLAATGSLKELQEVICLCPGKASLDSIQQNLLSVIVDKTEQMLTESTPGLVSANLMVADENKKSLTLTVFARHASNRRKIDIAFGVPGAGRAINEMKPVYIPDIWTPALRDSFREDAPYRSILSIPMACDHRKLGVVNIDHAHPGALSTEMVTFLEPFVHMIGLSLCLSWDSEQRLAAVGGER